MDRLWLDAPLPALLVEHAQTSAGVRVKANLAAHEWARQAGVNVEQLQAWAAGQATLPAAAASEFFFGRHRVRCVPVPLPSGVLLWLQPLPDGRPEERPAQHGPSAEYLDRALVMAGVSVWRIDLATQRIHFNTVGFQISGNTADPAGITLDNMRATIHPDDRTGVVNAAQQALASDAIVDAIARYRNVDGSWRTLLTRRIVERDEAGQPMGLAGVSIDLTPLLAERERSQVLADRTRLATEALGVGFWSRDLASGVLHWDEQMYGIYARPRELGPPAPGQWLTACVHPQDQSWMAQRIRQADDNAEPLVETVYRAQDRDGQARWIQSFSCRGVRAGQRMVYGMNLDVTERQAAEAKQVERQQLDQASREQSAFMARMSHELRTPMNAVLGFTRLLETDAEQPPTERQGDRLAHIGSAGRQLLGLIDDLLQVAQREPAPAAAEPSGGLHVLCVEDNPVNLQLVCELIALRPQVRLRTAVDGLSGVQAALAEPPDLLLLDLQLPDIDGMEVMRRLRAVPSMAACRIVALSADAMPDHIQAALAAGFDDYWTKPIQFDNFLAQIDRLVK